MDWNKMDSIVTRDKKIYFVSNNSIKTRGTYVIIKTWKNKTLNVYYNWGAKLK
jgi:hypothetical protein